MKKKSRSNLEVIVGAVVFVLAAAFLVFAFTGGGVARGGYLLTAKFRQVDGLNVGSPVHLAGIKVGEVAGLAFDSRTNKAVVTLRIASGIKLSDDTAAQVVTDGLLGAKFIKLVPGGAEATIPPGGQIYYVQDGLIVERLLQRLIENAEVNRKRRIEAMKRCRCGAGGNE